MYYPGMDPAIARDLKELGCQSVLAGLSTFSVTNGLVTLAVGAVALPLLYQTTPYIEKGFHSLVQWAFRHSPKGICRKAEAVGQQLLVQKQTFAQVVNTAIIGRSFPLSAVSLLTLPLANNPQIYLETPERLFIKIDLDQLDTLQCGAWEKRLLRCAKIFIDTRKQLYLDNPSAPMRFAAAYLILTVVSPQRLSSTRLTRIAATAYFALGLIGYPVKYAALKYNHITPSALSAPPAPSSSSVPRPPSPETTELVVSSASPLKAATSKENLEAHERHLRVRKWLLGDLSCLPLELILNIIHRLPQEQIDGLIDLNPIWKSMCTSLVTRLHVLREQYGAPLVDKIGLQLLNAPWVDLGDTLVDNPPFDEAKWHEQIGRNLLLSRTGYYQSAIALRELIQSQNGSEKSTQDPSNIKGYPAIFHGSLTNKDKLWNFFDEFRGKPSVPTISIPNHPPSPFIYWLTTKHFRGRAIIKIKDKAGRFGLALRYLYTFQKEGKSITVPGIAVLHQLRADRPEYYWSECQTPYQFLQNGIFEHRELVDAVGEQNNLKQFYFIYSAPEGMISQTEFNLNWLNKFINGEKCGTLIYGMEACGNDFPTMQLADADLGNFFTNFFSFLGRKKEI